jgi:HK97 gp10 family phage protein
MSLVQTTIKWDATAYLKEVRRALNEIVEYGAKMTEEDAKKNLERMAPNSTGKLASQIDIKKSKFKDGGWVVEAQGAGNYDVVTSKSGKIRRRYYASFVELGTSKMQGLGYLRKALRRNKYRMRAKIRQQFGEVR